MTLRLDLCKHVRARGCHLWKLDLQPLIWRCVWCLCSMTDEMMPH